MSKILIIGDLHGKKYTLDKCRLVLEKCKKLAENTDSTVFLGDLNDTKANIRAEIQNLFLEQLSDWPNIVNILVGNHDYCNSIECKDHSLEALKLLDNVLIVDSMTHDTESSIIAIPYLPEDRFLKLSLPEADYCFIHQDVLGAKYQNQEAIQTKITPELFKKYKRVFAGHIHMKQQIDNITYVGAPYTESFGEADQEKTVIIYDTIKDKIKEIDLELPKHVIFEYTINQLDDLKIYKQDLVKKIKPNNIVRVIIYANEELAPKVKRSLFSDLNIESLKVKKISTLANNVRIKESMGNKEIMESYINQLANMPHHIKKLVLKWNKQIMENK
jgi:hypothetical protein